MKEGVVFLRGVDTPMHTVHHAYEKKNPSRKCIILQIKQKVSVICGLN